MSNNIFLSERTPIEKGDGNENRSGVPIKCIHSYQELVRETV